MQNLWSLLFKLLWRIGKDFSVRDLGDNNMIFTFNDEADLERVLMNRLWSYDKHLVLLQTSGIICVHLHSRILKCFLLGLDS